MLPTAWEPEVGRRGGVAGAPSPRWPGSDYCGRELWGRRSLAGPSRKKSVSGPGAPRLPAAPRAAVWLGGPWQEGEPGREWTRRSGQRLSRAPKPGARTPPPPPPSPGRERTGGAGPGAPGPHKGKAPSPPGGVRDLEVTVEKVGPANCQLPPPQFSGLIPSSKVRVASSKSPHPCSHLPFYYTGVQKASL